MLITSLRDLKQVIKALREGGVTSAEIDGVKLTLLPKPASNVSKGLRDFSSDFPEANIAVPKFTPISSSNRDRTLHDDEAPLEADKIDTEELTEEQLMFYSSAGHEQ